MDVVIPRYLGSDDSDDGDQGAAKLKEVLHQAKKRKCKAEKLNSSTHSPAASCDGSTSLFEGAEPSFVHRPKKRRKCSLDSSLSQTHAAPESKNIATGISGEDPGVLHDYSSPSKVKKTKNKSAPSTELSSAKSQVLADLSVIDSGNTSHANPDSHDGMPKKKHKKLVNSSSDGDVDLCSFDAYKNLNASDVENSKNFQSNGDAEMFTIIGEVKKSRNWNNKRILPEWLSNPTVISVDVDGKKSSLSELDYLDDNVKNNLQRLKISHLFPVQVEVVPWLMQSNLQRLCVHPPDVCVSAPTGSGKTLAFVLPIIQSLKERVVCRVRALVVLPVGDLAFQVFKVFEQFCKGTDLHVALVVGQRSFSQEQGSLVKKGVRGFHSLVDIVVATPGRLTDHISYTEGFTLEYLKYLVIDEADRMMEEIQQGFLKKVEKSIFKDVMSSGCSCFSIGSLHKKAALPPTTPCEYGHISEPVQKLLYSATLSQDPERLHELSLFQPKLFTSVASNSLETVTKNNIIGKYTTPEGLVEDYVVCAPSVKPLIVSHLIQTRNFKRVLCFTKSVDSSHRLRLVLENMGDFQVREMSSSLQPVQRKIISEQFSSGKIQVLVCTDMMSRGIDIENVDCVISYDAPEFIKTYIHRVGRTARAGRKGCAVTLLENREVPQFLKMLRYSGKQPANRVEVDYEAMEPMEEQYKTALDATSRIISEEKRNKFLLKESVKSVKSTKNERFKSNVRATKNGRFKNSVRTMKNERFKNSLRTSKNERFKKRGKNN